MQAKNHRNLGLVGHSEIDIMVAYDCPDCSWKHYLSPTQYLYKEYVIVCDCGAVFKPKNPGIGYSAEQKTGMDQINKVGIKDNSNKLNIAIDILTSQGFSKTDVEKASHNITMSDSIDVIVSSIVQNL